MKAAIFASGDFKETKVIRQAIGAADFFIAADGGYSSLKKLGITPDVLIGDRDSLNEDFGEIFHIDYPTRKDMTDSELAIRYALDKGTTSISLFGATGTRLDHTLNNIFILGIPFKKKVPAAIFSEHNIITMVEGFYLYNKADYEDYKYFSLVPIDEGVFVTMKGFEYEVEDLGLRYSDYTGISISNRLIENEAGLSVRGGRCLAIFSRD